MLRMLSSLINLAVVLAVVLALWKVAGLGLKGLVYIVNFVAVAAVVAPGAGAAARAEKALPERELAFDFDGDQDEARLFDTIVRDRLRRTRMVALYPSLTMIATRIGRRLVGA